MAAETIGVSVGSKIAELLVEPIVHQFRYMFCFGNFVEDLRKHEKDLTLTQDRVQNAIDAAIRNAEEIEKDVQEWMKIAAQAIQDVKCLESEIQKEKRCSNWIWKYRLGRRMAKETTNLVQLQKKGNFPRVSYQSTPPSIEFLSEDFMPSESSQLALKQIMEALGDDNVNMIGLYGMAGVGKTTLVKEVGKQVSKLSLFDKVIMVVVSQTRDFMQIQDQLADKLYLYMHEKSKEGRANRIWQRLKNETKILIIIDDVWEYLDLKDIGIPFGEYQKGCKILLTTRLQHICVSMGCQRQIALHVLTEDETWALFKKNASICDDSSVCANIAMEVAKECKGLPIAIVTVGRALRSKSLETWEVASRKLKESRLTDIRDINRDDNAYTCLKLSFDYLQSEETKLCFLMCSLFPEDYEIFIEDLVRYAVGLGIYEGSQTVEEVRSEVFESICDLKASCMLLETDRKEYVKMHDMVRDFALWISSKEESDLKGRVGICLGGQTGSFKTYAALSLMDNKTKGPADGLVYPKLEMLLWDVKRTQFSREADASDSEEDSDDAKEDLPDVPTTSFKGMQELRTLYLSHGSVLMHSLGFLTNLQTLELKHCSFKSSALEGSCMDLTSLGKLKRLKILNLRDSSIRELPEEIGQLDDLRLLDLTRCRKLKKIPINVIRRLSRLEELYIGVESFGKWDVDEDNNQRSNASLMELNSLLHLSVLWLYVLDYQIPRGFVFPRLNRYRMFINNGLIDDRYPSRPGDSGSRSIYFEDGSDNMVNSCKVLFLNVCDLEVEHSGRCLVPDMDESGFNHLTKLGIFLCSMKCLISTKKQQVPGAAAFSNLREISLSKTNLTEICDGEPPMKFLEKLQTVSLVVFYGMVTVFPVKLWRALQNLETLNLRYCDSVQVVFQLDGLQQENKNLLSRLNSLLLEDLHNLRHIWKGPTHNVNLKSLTSLKLEGCNSLTCIFSPWLAHSLVELQTLDISYCAELKHIIAEGQESFPTAQRISLQKLKTLKIYGCNKLEYVFPASVAPGLLHLEEISIGSAAELNQFFGVGEQNQNLLLQPDVVKLGSSESNLCYFSTGNYAAVLPYLQHVKFEGCTKLVMNPVIKGSISSRSASVKNPEGVQLKTLILSGCEELEVIIAEDGDTRNYMAAQNHLQTVTFGNLLHIRVYRCNKLKRLFPISIAHSLPHLKYLEVIEACLLGEAFECNEDAEIKEEKEMVLPKLVRLILKELPCLICFSPANYHFMFPCLESLTVQGCPRIITRFSVALNGTVHAKTEKPQLAGEDLATTQTAATSGVVEDGINWNRSDQLDALPKYVEDEGKAKAYVPVVETPSSGQSRPTIMTKVRDLITRKKKAGGRGSQ